MNTIDQYYLNIITDLEQISEMAATAAKQMRAKMNESIDNRPLPIILSDIRTKVANAEKLATRYDVLSLLNVESISFDSITDETWVKPVGMPSVKTKNAK